MAEQVDLTSPVVTTVASYKLDTVTLDVRNMQIVCTLSGANGETPISKTYNNATSPTGAALLSSLNTSNNSAGTSLIKRVYNQLIASGTLAGTVSGSPQ